MLLCLCLLLLLRLWWLLLLLLLLRDPLLVPRLMPPTPRHPFIMAIHAIDALARLGEHELVDAVLAHLALEAVRVVRVVPGHDRLVEDGLLADVAAVRAVGAYRRAVGEQEQVRVRGDLVPALGAFEAVDMEKGLAEKGEHG